MHCRLWFATTLVCGVLTAAPWRVTTPSMTIHPTLYVSPKGDDGNPGTLEKPLASLEGARTALRKISASLPEGPVVVQFAGGEYFFPKAVLFTKEDSGSAAKPIIYRAAYGEKVVFTGGLDVGEWKPVTDEAVKARLPEKARDQVVVADVSGMQTLGKLPVCGFGKGVSVVEAELFYDDVPMGLSRWPKTGFRKVLGNEEDKKVVLDAEGRTETWKAERDPWILAYWKFDWAEIYEPIAGFGDKKDEILRPDMKAIYGVDSARARWHAFNLLCELSEPGEYVIDRTEKKLYFYPPHPKGRAVLSQSDALIEAKEVAFMSFEAITFQNVRGRLFYLAGDHNAITGCVFRNSGTTGCTLIGSHNTFCGNDIYNAGQDGVGVSGGDRKTLTPGQNNVENNHIHHCARRKRTYCMGISCSGCGNRIAHNLIHHMPHMAMSASGNNHVVEYNEVHNAVYESGDAGAFYVGRDWTQRGTVLRYNYWHHIKGSSSFGGMTIYLDDQHSGHDIIGNLFYRCNQPVFIGGGCDNSVINNVFIDCWRSAHLDNRGMGWQKDATMDPNGELRTYLNNMPYKNELWAKAYPTLVHILEDDPGVPKRNVFIGNVSAGGLFDSIENSTRHLQTVKDNLAFDDDSDWIQLKTDKHGKPANLIFKDPAALVAIGFKPLPLSKMGLQEDLRRASWPVVHPADEVALPQDGRKKSADAQGLSKMPTLSVPRARENRGVKMELPVTWDGKMVNKPPVARLSLKDDKLIVLIDSYLPNERSLGEEWGGNDATEVALMGSDGPNPDVFVLRGFTTGHFEAFRLSGGNRTEAPALKEAVELTCKVNKSDWQSRWAIPLSAIGVKPADRLRANVTVYRFGTKQFIMWRPTFGDSTNCDKVGCLELAP